jgi:pimeloyl-ACP methyl ester carboxylesterase
VLDYFNLDQIALVGVSLGGFLAPRAAAFEPRIAQVAAYDICYDAFECFTHNIGAEFREKFREMVLSEKRDEINALLEAVRKSDDMIDWIITHGMYITGAADPFDYFHYWTHFTTREASHRITQDVLLLAGEKDHFIPVEQLVRQREALVNARSVRSRLFTTAEGGEQHCQVGRLDLALNEIIDWLNGLYPAP